MNSSQNQPVQDNSLSTLEDKVQLLMVDQLAFLIVIAEDQCKGQYYETGYDHVVESLEVLNLKHEFQQRISKLEDFLRPLLLYLIFLDVTFGHAHLNVLCELLPETLQGDLYFLIELTLGLQKVDAFSLYY